VTLSIADPAAGLGMKSMTQRAGEPHGIFGGRHPSEGVKALWAFHSLILAQLFSLVSIFLGFCNVFNRILLNLN
jgi:hypothetical protein